jgi:hypothetical protein
MRLWRILHGMIDWHESTTVIFSGRYITGIGTALDTSISFALELNRLLYIECIANSERGRIVATTVQTTQM